MNHRYPHMLRSELHRPADASHPPRRRRRAAGAWTALLLLLALMAAAVPSASAAGTAVIKGAVTAEGVAVASVTVNVFLEASGTYSQVTSGTTDAEGKYGVTGLSAGAYKLEFVPPGTALAFQFHRTRSFSRRARKHHFKFHGVRSSS